MNPGRYRALADLIYDDAAPLRAFLDGRRRHKNLLAGSLRFLAWGVLEPVRAFGYAARTIRADVGIAVPEPAVAATRVARPEPVAMIEASHRATVAAEAETAPADERAVPVVAEIASPAARDTFRLPPTEAPREVARAAPSEAPRLVRRPALAPQPALPQETAVVPPITAEAWQMAMHALVDETPPVAGTRTTRLDAAEWRACVLALADAERGVAGHCGTASASLEIPAALATAAGAETRAERRDPLSRGAALRDAA